MWGFLIRGEQDTRETPEMLPYEERLSEDTATWQLPASPGERPRKKPNFDLGPPVSRAPRKQISGVSAPHLWYFVLAAGAG